MKFWWMKLVVLVLITPGVHAAECEFLLKARVDLNVAQSAVDQMGNPAPVLPDLGTDQYRFNVYEISYQKNIWGNLTERERLIYQDEEWREPTNELLILEESLNTAADDSGECSMVEVYLETRRGKWSLPSRNETILGPLLVSYVPGRNQFQVDDLEVLSDEFEQLQDATYLRSRPGVSLLFFKTGEPSPASDLSFSKQVLDPENFYFLDPQ